MKTLRTITTKLFIPLAFFLRPALMQRMLRKTGIPIPYFLAKQLNYQGVVDFKIGDQRILMQSYNTPIEITIFWKSVFAGREGAELRIWHALSRKTKNILDIGANTGVYSLVAATNKDAKIFAFEPVPVVFKMLEKNISLNNFSHIQAQPEVVTNLVGQTNLYIPKTGWVDVASVEKEFAAKYAQDDCLQQITCDAVTVDTFVDKHIPSDEMVLAKVDVEGAELKVIEGMKNTLQQQRVSVLAELLNEAAFAEVYEVLPETYCVYGVIQVEPYLQKTNSYVKGIKNYLLIPKNLAPGLEIS